MKTRFLFLGCLLALAGGLGAHEGRHIIPPTPAAVPTAQAVQAAALTPVAEAAVPAHVIRIPHDLFSHMHNKLVHFPVALGVVAALMILLNYRWPEFQISVRLLLFLAALGAAAAYITGRNQAEEFVTGPYSGILETHRLLGTTTLVLLWLGAVLSFIPWARKIMWVVALLLAFVVMATGFFGGILAAA